MLAIYIICWHCVETDGHTDIFTDTAKINEKTWKCFQQRRTYIIWSRDSEKVKTVGGSERARGKLDRFVALKKVFLCVCYFSTLGSIRQWFFQSAFEFFSPQKIEQNLSGAMLSLLCQVSASSYGPVIFPGATVRMTFSLERANPQRKEGGKNNTPSRVKQKCKKENF